MKKDAKIEAALPVWDMGRLSAELTRLNAELERQKIATQNIAGAISIVKHMMNVLSAPATPTPPAQEGLEKTTKQ